MIREPHLHIRPAARDTDTRAIVLVLPGGRARSTAPAHRRHLAYQRMVLFSSAIHRAAADHGVAVWQLRYRVRGWNGAARDPVRDTAWALGRIGGAHPGAQVILVGHSMGGRAALYASIDPAVTAVCAVAPWIEPGDPFEHLGGGSRAGAATRSDLLVVAHGTADRITDPRTSLRYAHDAAEAGARVAHFIVPGDKHAMMRRATDWHALTSATVLEQVGVRQPTQLSAVLADPQDLRFEVPLAVTRQNSATHPATPYTR